MPTESRPRTPIAGVRIALFILLLLTTLPAAAQRESRTINDGWSFRFGDLPDGTVPAAGDDTWTPVHLPHTWNTDAYTEKNYLRGTGWYLRTLDLPPQWTGRRILLRFEGVNKSAAVYVDGEPAGEHRGGYTSFTIDITPQPGSGTRHTLAVRTDNADDDIPPLSGDFTFFGGIYRDVWLTAVAPQHFDLDDFGAEALYLSAPQVSDTTATLRIRGTVRNDADRSAAVALRLTLRDPDGRATPLPELTLHPAAHAGAEFDTEIEIPHPRLWTPETPALYTVEAALCDPRTRAELDCTRRQTGFRWFRFDPEAGFLLNGRPYKLRGICRHQDQQPYGTALADETHRRDFRLMKEMGANFIRISHYPQDDALLEACDREGMLVWEEIPVIDIVPDSEAYADCCERNLREMIRQHYDHPSIILWGYMNEILLKLRQRNPEAGEAEAILARTTALAGRLERVVKEEDPARASVMAFHGDDIYNTTGISDGVDVVGWNLYQGWYGGDLEGFDRFVGEQHAAHPDHPILVSEYGAGSDRRLHSADPQPFDFSCEYQQRYLEHYLPLLERTPWLCGGSHWNFIDFCSALRDEAMPRINNKGLVCADRTPKDVYYYYKASWREDIPVLHIAARDWTQRAGIREGDAPVVQSVKVYTNLPEAELLLDGRSIGTKKAENRTIRFEVPFDDGEHLLLARGTTDRGERVEDALRIGFASTPSRLADAGLTTAEVAVNVGSRCFFTSDESRLTWLPDRPYAPGGWGYVGGREAATQTQIACTADNPLYQTLREGIEAYRFDLPEGLYEVELLFADIYRPTETPAYLLGRGATETAATGNRFAIEIDGATVEPEFAPAEAGCFRAVRRRYLVRHDAGTLDIAFRPIEGRTLLSGIKIRKR